MDREYCAKINNIYTSQASPEKKSEALRLLNESHMTQQEKMNNILVDIAQSSPDVPDAFTTSEGVDNS